MAETNTTSLPQNKPTTCPTCQSKVWNGSCTVDAQGQPDGGFRIQPSGWGAPEYRPVMDAQRGAHLETLAAAARAYLQASNAGHYREFAFVALATAVESLDLLDAEEQEKIAARQDPLFYGKETRHG